MKKIVITLLVLAFLPIVAHAQADQKLINKAQQGDPAAMVKLGECYENGAGVAHDSTLALKWFQKAADLGDCMGWLRLSRYYLTGSAGVTKDTARYFSIRKDWANQGCPNAMAALGVAYEFGTGCKADTAKALELYEKAVKAGSSWAYENMGVNYLNGEMGVPKDEKKAVAYFQKALKLGNTDCYARLANYYAFKQDYKKAWKYANEGMKWGDPEAATLAAHMYGLGHGVEQDEAKAMHLLDSLIREHHNLSFTQALAGIYYMSADNLGLRDSNRAISIWEQGDIQGSSLCRMSLGNQYYAQERYEEALAYYKKVANNNTDDGYQGEACRFLSDMYYNGLGCEKDEEQSVVWLKRGVEKFHNSECAMALASYYEDKEDLTQTAKYCRLADQYGDTNAMIALGRLYANNGNSDMAADCFQKVIDRGQAEGYYWMAMLYDAQGDAKTCNDYLFKGEKKGDPSCAGALGTIYENGLDGYKVDYKKAAKYYEKSGTSKSLYRLGIMYLDGNLGKQKEADVAKGMDYVKQSAEQGYIDAIYAIGYCYETGRNVDSVDHEKALAAYQLLADNDIAAGQFKVGLYYELGDGGLEADSVKAIEYYQKAADQGHGEAMCYLADFYRIGRYLPLDQAKAFELYYKAHETGEEMGTYYVGRSYLEGCGVDIDSTAAISYLKAAAHQGVGNAAYRVAEFYNYGLGGLEADGDSAVAYYFMGHNNGSGDASYYIGRQLLQEGAYDKATDFLYVGAQRNNVDAMVTFAICLQQGVGFKEEDPKTAYHIFENVAHNYGDPRAYYQLGLACLQGNGCPEDESLGKAYLDTAVSLGSLQAPFTLGVCYLNGYGCRVDTAMAITWLEKAADNENINAINQLGKVYEAQGDFKNAVLYYEKGVTHGSLESYCNLGYCYEQGQGVVLNSQKAFELYKYAAEQGYNRGCRSVAGCYLNGIYVETSAAEALNWLTKAAENGDVLAMYYCGSILEEGEDGVPANPKKAKEWYKKAAAAGYDPAAAALSRMK